MEIFSDHVFLSTLLTFEEHILEEKFTGIYLPQMYASCSESLLKRKQLREGENTIKLFTIIEFVKCSFYGYYTE